MDTAVFVRKIVTGEGSIKVVGSIIDQYKPERVALFADPIVLQLGLAEVIEEILKNKKIEYMVYSDITPEPSVMKADEAVKVVRDYKTDMVIAVGGGSCLDLAKVAACMVKNEGSVADYLNLTGTKKFNNPGVTKILIPTTAGTGSEVTFNAVFALETSKDIISSEYILADVAIIDPELTYTVPSKPTAASGIDALAHAIESLTSKGATEITDTLALEAVRKINRNIRTAVWNGSDVKARGEMAWGSLLASLSYFNSGVHAVHALAYPLGGLFHLSHGESNAAVLPYVFDNIWVSCLAKMGAIAEALDLVKEGKNDREIALMTVKYLQDLTKDVGLPVSIKEYGIKETDLDGLAEDAAKQKRLLGKCPKQLRLEDIRKIYQNAYDGKIDL